MKLLLFLSLVVTVLAQTQTESLGITTTAVPSATLPITPPPQRSLAVCSADPLWRRLRNAEGLDPCALAMNLQRTCTTIDPIPALTGGESYTGPTSVAGATACICTTVMYNLVAACAACQHQLSNNISRNWVPWSTWSALCQSRSQIVDGGWNRVTQYNSTIPAWAFAKVFQSDWFDLQQAVNLGYTSSSSLPSSTSTAPASTSGSDPKVGAIVGGVLGGIGFILLLLTILFCFLRRRQRKWEEREGVNEAHSPHSPYVVGKSPTSLQKPDAAKYGIGGLTSPTRPRFDEKPRAVKTETALPDVLADEHRQGKPDYTYPTAGGGFGYERKGQQGEYIPVPNPGVAGIGAGGRGLAPPAPVSRVPPRDGPEGVAAQMVAADIAAAQRLRQNEGIFREDFDASEGHGYRSSNDADSRHFRNVGNGNGNGNGYGNGNGNGNGRGAHPPSSYPFPMAPVPERNGGLAPERADEDVHAYSTVGDASISVYPSSGDHGEAPPPFVGGFTVPPEKEEYRLPDRGYSSGYVVPGSGGSGSPASGNGGIPASPGHDADPFAANRRPAAFSRVFGDRPSPTAGTSGANRSPTTPVINRPGGSPILTRGGAPNANPAPNRRGGGPGSAPQNMGFGRQHQAAVGASHRDSGAFSEESSPTAVGFAGDVGSARGEGSPLPTGPFAGRSGFGAGR